MENSVLPFTILIPSGCAQHADRYATFSDSDLEQINESPGGHIRELTAFGGWVENAGVSGEATMFTLVIHHFPDWKPMLSSDLGGNSIAARNPSSRGQIVEEQ